MREDVEEGLRHGEGRQHREMKPPPPDGLTLQQAWDPDWIALTSFWGVALPSLCGVSMRIDDNRDTSGDQVLASEISANDRAVKGRTRGRSEWVNRPTPSRACFWGDERADCRYDACLRAGGYDSRPISNARLVYTDVSNS